MAHSATMVTSHLELKWMTLASSLITQNEDLVVAAQVRSLADSVKLCWSPPELVYNGIEPPATQSVRSTEKADIENHSSIFRYLNSLHCSRDHDRVFGLHAILKALGYNLLPPDYGRPVSEVFQEFAVSSIRLSGSLLPLTTTLPPKPSTGLPSWIPNWSTIQNTIPAYDTGGTFSAMDDLFVFDNGKELAIYQARSRNGNIAEWDCTRGSLQVRGKHVGKFHSRIWEGNSDEGFLRACRQWCRTLNVSDTNGFITLSTKRRFD